MLLTWVEWCLPLVRRMTIDLPDHLRRERRGHRIVPSDTVVLCALQEWVDKLCVYDRALSKSRLTEGDAVELGRVIRRTVRTAT